jgi:hypothetical protein
MLILSYATKDKKYLNYADRLIQNFAALKYKDYKIIYYPSCNNKYDGCNIKPTVILEQLLYYKKQILVIDVDSIIKEYPKISNYVDYDIGFVYTPERKNKITNGIHLWNYTNNTINFLKRWQYLCNDKKLRSLDHHRLIQTFEEFKNKLNIINIRKDISNWFIAELNYNNSYVKF